MGKIRSVIDQHLIEASAKGNREIIEKLSKFSAWLTEFYIKFGKDFGSRSGDKFKK